MRIKELKSMTDIELKDKINDLQKELIRLNAQIATKIALKNPSHVRNIKKGIARVRGLLEGKTLAKEVSKADE